tara:strand:+ start:902 stop:1306 length:405 start_codon:yes stop_codon:yes gene_type:complete
MEEKMLDDYIKKMLKAASKAANKAHDECVPTPMAFQSCDSIMGGFDKNKPYTVEKDGSCGGAYIKVIGPGKNMISKELKSMGIVDGDSYMGYSIDIDYNHRGSQSADRAEAAMKAASKVLKKYGLPNSVTAYLT